MTTLDTFRALLRQARSAMPADPGAARGFLSNAEALWGSLTDSERSDYGDELAFARQVVSGDSAALADSQAGAALATSTAATVAAEDAKSSQLGAYVEGFGEGLSEGAANLGSALSFGFSWKGALAVGAALLVAVYVYGRARA